MKKLNILLFISVMLLSASAYSNDIDLEKKNEITAQYITEDPSENEINVVPRVAKKKGQKGGFFSNTVLYQTMLADPRKIQYSTGVRFKDTAWINYETDPSAGKRTGVIGTDRTFWTFSLGDRIGLYLFDFGLGHSLQLEVEAGMWSLFSILEKGNPTGYNTIMLNADFKAGVPITYSWNDFSLKFSYYHESSHLGDEFIKYGVKGNVFDLDKRVNPSSEVLDLYLSYNLIKEIRIYTGIGVHLVTDATYPVKPLYIDYGIEFRPFDKWTIGSQSMIQLFAALHIRTIQDVSWDPDLTVVLGLELIPTGDDSRRRVRLYGEYHYGYSVEGQFSKNKTDYFNIMLAFGF